MVATGNYKLPAAWVDPVYSARGNMTTAPKPGDLENTFSCTEMGHALGEQIPEIDANVVVGRYWDISHAAD